MISKDLLSIVRPRPSDTGGLVYAGGIERDGMILGGKARSPATGEPFPNERELEIIKRLVRPLRGGRYLDLGCSAGLYTRSLSGNLDSGAAVGIDISPSMLREAARRARGTGANPSFVRANAKHLPFLDTSL